VVVLSRQSSCLEVTDPGSLCPSELRSFLGSIPAILTAERALVVEGEDASFDKIFYRWVAGKDFEVIPIGSCWDVYSATTRLGVWECLAPSVRLLGIMDRDFRSDDSVKDLSGERCLLLDFHEAESFLCFPAILKTLAEQTKILEDDITEANVEEWILEFARNALLRVAAQRTFYLATVSLNVSLPKQTLAGVKDKTQLLPILRRECEREASKAHEKLSADQIEKSFNFEHDRAFSAVTAKNLELILRIFPGKELLEILSKKLGFKNSRQLLVAATKHLDPSVFPEFSSLRKRILSALGEHND